MSLAVRMAGVLILSSVLPVRSQAPAGKEADVPPARWMLLFRSDDPSAWDRDAKGPTGAQIAIPVRHVPAEMRYLRLRRMDSGEALILPMTREQLLNAKPDSRANYWWNGTAKEEWGGRHLGIVQAPRRAFPVPHGMICVMNEGWDGWAGSGFGHKAFTNDHQHYCWRGQEIPRTTFEIGVSPGPLSRGEMLNLVSTLNPNAETPSTGSRRKSTGGSSATVEGGVTTPGP